MGGLDWMDLAHDGYRWLAYECGNEHSDSIKCGKFHD